MAISVSYLAEGSRISDSRGNTYILVAHGHYGYGQATLLSEKCVTQMAFSSTATGSINYESSNIHNYLSTTYVNSLSDALKKHILTTQISYVDILTRVTSEDRTISAKCFLLSSTELGASIITEPNNNAISYLGSQGNRVCDDEYWTRTEITRQGNYASLSQNAFAVVFSNGFNNGGSGAYANDTRGVRPAFNVSYSLMVEEDVNYGYYRLIESNPPQIGNISNLVGNYGSATTINYTVKNESGSNLTHYFSTDSGNTWQKINPVKNGNNYYFNHVFNEVKTHYCKIKVVDTEKNSATSNTFTVSLNHSVPNITILGHNDLEFRFKATCATSEISKIEIYINDKLEDTLTTNLDFTQTYSINKALLTKSKNAILVKATSKANSVGSKGLEVIKVSYDLPVVGSKVIIIDNVYTVLSATKTGDNMILTLKEELVEKVLKGDVISILQDNINVKCSLSNIENDLNYNDMNLVKIKVLKGDFEGYIEEKYVLEGEGRYSAIKIELERFSEDVNVEVAELQQMFDYLVD